MKTIQRPIVSRAWILPALLVGLAITAGCSKKDDIPTTGASGDTTRSYAGSLAGPGGEGGSFLVQVIPRATVVSAFASARINGPLAVEAAVLDSVAGTVRVGGSLLVAGGTYSRDSTRLRIVAPGFNAIATIGENLLLGSYAHGSAAGTLVGILASNNVVLGGAYCGTLDDTVLVRPFASMAVVSYKLSLTDSAQTVIGAAWETQDSTKFVVAGTKTNTVTESTWAWAFHNVSTTFGTVHVGNPILGRFQSTAGSHGRWSLAECPFR